MKDLFMELEIEARRRASQLEWNLRLPKGFTEKHYPMTREEQKEMRRLRAADAAATNVDVWLALVRGDAVPARALNSRIVQDHKRRLRGHVV